MKLIHYYRRMVTRILCMYQQKHQTKLSMVGQQKNADQS